MSQNPRGCAEPAKDVGSTATPGPSIPASEHLQVRVGRAAASHRCPHISSSSHVEDGQTSLHRSASAASSQETQTYSGPSKESNTVAGPGVRNNCHHPCCNAPVSGCSQRTQLKHLYLPFSLSLKDKANYIFLLQHTHTLPPPPGSRLNFGGKFISIIKPELIYVAVWSHTLWLLHSPPPRLS